ncbi:hypothetical protein Dda_3909 [Drechslerella dactyloides]|uniref:Sorting nexin-4 n=1 Tax=Drechslerella dactyloides TaxID=74499 RepID=A0AAD6J345_DREDA|nr:hypothetical protein Dda_3909 [Drechslerella dactyloides]
MDDFSPSSWRTNDSTGSSQPPYDQEPQIGPNADKLDTAGLRAGGGRLECNVSDPQKENDGTKDAFVSYLVTTDTDFPTFQKHHVGVRRRFTDFVFLYKSLHQEHANCAVPPLPDKQRMEYVRGDRFGYDFTNRRAASLNRFLKRLTLHPVLRKTPLLTVFLESPDWNAHMRSRSTRLSNASDNGVFDGLTDTFLNAFSKVHKPDRRFIEVRERADKLTEDLTHVSGIFARVVRREGDLELDYADLATQFHKIEDLEPNLRAYIKIFSTAVEETAGGMRDLKEHSEQHYLTSLKDMDAYIASLKQLLKLREQKQLDYEALTDYLAKAAYDRDQLASQPPHSTGMGASGFFRSKVEDMRGVDHEQSRRERIRKLELRIDELTREAEDARKQTEAFDESVVREIDDFERIKTIEFKDTLGDLAMANIDFYRSQIAVWEKMLRDSEG